MDASTQIAPSQDVISNTSKLDQDSSKYIFTHKIKLSLLIGGIVLFLLASLIGNFFQYSQTQNIRNETKKYLTLQGEKCNQDINVCLNNIIVRLQTKPVLSKAKGGLCLVRDGYTNMPSSTDPDVGKGYAKLTKIGINTIDQLRQSCNENDYAKLMQEYCAQNSNPIQFEVATVGVFGGPESSGGSPLDSGLVGCPRK